MDSDINPSFHHDFKSDIKDEPADYDLDNEETIFCQSLPIVETLKTIRCVNCATDVTKKRSYNLKFVELKTIVTQWIAPRVVGYGDLLCYSCWVLALKESENVQIPLSASTSNDQRRPVCVNCRRSLARTRFHTINTNTERETRIRNQIIKFIHPRQLHGTDIICHSCWIRSDKAAMRSSTNLTPKKETSLNTIHLPHLTRAPDSQSCCFFPECNSKERLLTPKWLRVKLFTDHKFYVSKTSRICKFHLSNDNWKLLANNPNSIHNFTADHIEDFASFVNERTFSLDFSNVEAMSEELFKYWLGLSKEQFKQLLPRLKNIKKGELALAAYLLKTKTGDSNAKISTLMNIPRTTLVRLINKTRKIFEEKI